MAGTGPAPKDPAERRNKTPPKRGEWVDLPPLEKEILPVLPPGEWEDGTRALWAAWREDPVTAEYTPADIAYALETIKLHNADATGKAAEIRLRMDALGLTPKGKRDLRWRVAAAPAGDEQKTSPKRKSSSARRGRLEVVK